MGVCLKITSGSQISRENVFQRKKMIISVIQKELQHVVLSPKRKLLTYELSHSALENHGCVAR